MAAVVAGCGVLALSAMTPQAARAQQPRLEAPFGNRVSGAVSNYNRLRVTIATAGLLREGAVAELKALRFAAIIDLRMSEEGTAGEQQAVEAAGLRYANIPISAAAPTEAQLDQFARLVEDGANHPLLVHCASANRVGALWTHYLVQRKGVPFALAVEEGRAIGLQPSREAGVRAALGGPAN
ncbi:MAG: phosphatase [Xanthobacteraceae bacterium]|nr:MAG: phosphatase [Xanthobacteraceae bacterium]